MTAWIGPLELRLQTNLAPTHKKEIKRDKSTVEISSSISKRNFIIKVYIQRVALYKFGKEHQLYQKIVKEYMYPPTPLHKSPTTLLCKESQPILLCEGIWQHCCVKDPNYTAVRRNLTTLLCEEPQLHCCVRDPDYTAVWRKSTHTAVWRNPTTQLCADNTAVWRTLTTLLCEESQTTMLCEGIWLQCYVKDPDYSQPTLLQEGIWLHCCMKDPNYTAVWNNLTTLCVKSPHTAVWRNLTTLLCEEVTPHWGVKESDNTVVWRNHSMLQCEEFWQHCCVKKSLHIDVWSNLTKLLCEEVTPHCCVKESDFTVAF